MTRRNTIDDAFSRDPDPMTPARVKQIVDQFRRANRWEQRPISVDEIMRLICDTIPENISDEDLSRIVTKALRPYDGPVTGQAKSPTARDILKERRKIAVRERRKQRR